MSFARSLFAPVINAYKRNVINNLKKAGLRAEDLVRVHEMDELGAQAVALLPEHAQQARIRRLIRAQDLSSKHLELPLEQQKLQQTTKQELIPIIKHLEQRELERKTYK